MKTLNQWIPDDANFDMPHLEKLLNCEILAEYDGTEYSYPLANKYKNVFSWVVVKFKNKLYAIGWNESPRDGWSFPKKLLKGISSVSELETMML